MTRSGGMVVVVVRLANTAGVGRSRISEWYEW